MSEWKTVVLGDILTPAQTKEVARIIRQNKDSTERVKKLKEYLAQFRAELETKGVVPEYLAYVLEAHALGVLPNPQFPIS